MKYILKIINKINRNDWKTELIILKITWTNKGSEFQMKENEMKILVITQRGYWYIKFFLQFILI